MALTPYFLFPTGGQDASNITVFSGTFNTGTILDDIASLRLSAGQSARWDYTVAKTELWYHFFVQFGDTLFNDSVALGAFFRISKNPTVLFELRFNSTTRKIEAWSIGTPSTLLASGSKVFNANQVYHLQLRYKINNATGVIQLKVDKTAADVVYDIDFTGDTQPGSDTDFDQLVLMDNFAAGSSPIYYSSLYVDSAAFQGTIRMKTYKPNREGNYVAWSRSAATTGYVLLNDIPHNSDTNYIYSQTLNQKNSVGFEAFDGPSNSVILATAHIYMSRRVSSGSFDGYGRSNSVDGTPQNIVPGSNYRSNYNLMQLDPATVAAWTVARLQDQTATGVEAVSEMKA